MSKHELPDDKVEIRTGLMVEGYDSLGGPETSLTRRQALGASMSSRHSLDDIPQDIVKYTAKNYPKVLEAPDVWEEPSVSSIERYSREQEPALQGGV